jgi:hypothetical protein
LSVAEQTLIRVALSEAPLAGTIQTYGRRCADPTIEVRHFPGGDSNAYSVITVEVLGQALADPANRDGEAWGVGMGCVFTFRGLAIWRNAWSAAWSSRLHFD